MSITTELQRISRAKSALKIAIESKGVAIDETETIDTYASKVDEIQSGSAGGDDLTVYASGIKFPNDSWVEDDTFELNMPNLKDLTGSFNFSFSKIKNLIITSNTPITATVDCFYGGNDSSVLEKVVFNVDFSQCTSFNRWFNKHSKLILIEGNPINFFSATTIGNIFNYCPDLESFRVARETIKANINFSRNEKLDSDTITSVIEGLSILPEGTSRTLTLPSTIKSNLTQEQINEITTVRKWTLA